MHFHKSIALFLTSLLSLLLPCCNKDQTTIPVTPESKLKPKENPTPADKTLHLKYTIHNPSINPTEFIRSYLTGNDSSPIEAKLNPDKSLDLTDIYLTSYPFEIERLTLSHTDRSYILSGSKAAHRHLHNRIREALGYYASKMLITHYSLYSVPAESYSEETITSSPEAVIIQRCSIPFLSSTDSFCDISSDDLHLEISADYHTNYDPDIPILSETFVTYNNRKIGTTFYADQKPTQILLGLEKGRQLILEADHSTDNTQFTVEKTETPQPLANTEAKPILIHPAKTIPEDSTPKGDPIEIFIYRKPIENTETHGTIFKTYKLTPGHEYKSESSNFSYLIFTPSHEDTSPTPVIKADIHLEDKTHKIHQSFSFLAQPQPKILILGRSATHEYSLSWKHLTNK